MPYMLLKIAFAGKRPPTLRLKAGKLLALINIEIAVLRLDVSLQHFQA